MTRLRWFFWSRLMDLFSALGGRFGGHRYQLWIWAASHAADLPHPYGYACCDEDCCVARAEEGTAGT